MMRMWTEFEASMFEDIDRLSAILAAEAEGQQVDQDEAKELAGRLQKACPTISTTLGRIADRMSRQRLAS